MLLEPAKGEHSYFHSGCIILRNKDLSNLGLNCFELDTLTSYFHVNILFTPPGSLQSRYVCFVVLLGRSQEEMRVMVGL